MSLELRRNVSDWWYGRLQANGRRYLKNLGLKVEGRIPPTLRQTGNIGYRGRRLRPRESDTVFRKPVSVEELAISEEKAQADPFIYPLILTGMCTAMRCGDCCTLQRREVVEKNDFVTVKTLKSGETVQIPIFPLLREVLEKAMARGICPLNCHKNNTVFVTMKRAAEPQYTDQSILRLVESDDSGRAFSAGDFATLGSPAAVRKALERLTKAGRLRRIRRGFYDRPRPHPLLGETAPDPMQLVRSVMKSTGAQWQVSGAYAANQLHLTDQVPGRIVVLTNGVPRKITLGKLTLDFRRAAPRNLLGAGKTSGLVFQSLRYLGKDQVTPAVVARLQRDIDPATKQELAKLAPIMAAWLRPFIQQITAS